MYRMNIRVQEGKTSTAKYMAKRAEKVYRNHMSDLNIDKGLHARSVHANYVRRRSLLDFTRSLLGRKGMRRIIRLRSRYY